MTTSRAREVKPRRTSYLIKRLDNAVREMLESSLSAHDITLAQYTILSVVSNTDGMSSADVSRRLDVTKQATNEMINILERRRLISRSSDDANRRILRIKLTAAGRILLKACDRSVDRSERAFLAGISATREASLRRTIELLVD
jgi:DNA-binding MarR family transcriptional regulator